MRSLLIALVIFAALSGCVDETSNTGDRPLAPSAETRSALDGIIFQFRGWTVDCAAVGALAVDHIEANFELGDPDASNHFNQVHCARGRNGFLQLAFESEVWDDLILLTINSEQEEVVAAERMGVMDATRDYCGEEFLEHYGFDFLRLELTRYDIITGYGYCSSEAFRCVAYPIVVDFNALSHLDEESWCVGDACFEWLWDESERAALTAATDGRFGGGHVAVRGVADNHSTVFYLEHGRGVVGFVDHDEPFAECEPDMLAPGP